MPPDTLHPRQTFFYGVQGTPFVDATEAWFWALDCLEARADRSRGCASLKLGRPCEPDDVVNAMARLDLPPVHARTVLSWGKRRMAPPEATEARRLWDEVFDRLSVALAVKGIIHLSQSRRGSDGARYPSADRRAGDLALMDVPLTGVLPPDRLIRRG